MCGSRQGMEVYTFPNPPHNPVPSTPPPTHTRSHITQMQSLTQRPRCLDLITDQFSSLIVCLKMHSQFDYEMGFFSPGGSP